MDDQSLRHNPFLTDDHTLEDALHFSDFRPILGDILMQAATPLTVGIFGPWGSGKTSLLEMLRQEIEVKGLASVRTVWITAWKYDRHEALWRVFILRVLDVLYPREAGVGPRETRSRLSVEKLTESQIKLVEELSHLEESIYRPVEWQELGRWTVNWWQALREGSKAAAEIAAAFLPGAALFKQALEVIGKDNKADDEMVQAAQAFQRQVKSYHREQLVHIEQFEKTFAQVLEMAEIERLIVFVDDLDRCLPEKAIEVLEAIKLFLEVPGTVFVLGMDKEVIERGVELRYKNFFQEGNDDLSHLELPISGDAYLQKMVQIPFYLPPLGTGQIEKYIGGLESGLPSQARLSEMTRQVLAEGIFPNPRQVKRVLNILRLLKGLVKQREQRPLEEGGLPPGKIAWPLLAKAVLIQSQFPELYRDWKEYPTMVRSLEEAYTLQPISEELIVTGESEDRMGSKFTEEERVEILGQSPSVYHGGLLEPYITNRRKYALLERLLTFPKPEESGNGRERARFAGLTRVDLEAYLFLVSVAEEIKSPGGTAASESILEGLLSGDLARQNDALAQFEMIEPNEQKIQRQNLQNLLLLAMQSPQRIPKERASAADSLDYLDWLIPDLNEFVSISGQGDTLPYWISKYPITNIQYQRFLEADDFADYHLWTEFPKFDENSCLMEGNWGDQGWDWLHANWDESHKIYPRYWHDPRFGKIRKRAPVVGVTWFEANAYCRWLLRHWDDPDFFTLRLANPGLHPNMVRLPTEKEWILAAGGESPKGRYPWDESGLVTSESEEVIRRANAVESGIHRTTPVDMYPLGMSKPQKLWDMAGNVKEWQANYYDRNQEYIALRGGSWDRIHEYSRVSFRANLPPSGAWLNDGFRIVVV